MLAVVEHQQHLALAQAIDQTPQRIAVEQRQLEQACQVRANQLWVIERRQIHQSNTVAIMPDQLFSHAQGYRGFTDPTGADQGNAAPTWQLRHQPVDQRLTANHPRAPQGQIVPTVGIARRSLLDRLVQDRRNKTVPALRHGNDIALASLTVAQCLAQRCHVHPQVDVFDDAVRPDGGHQLLLAHHLAGVAQQSQENVHRSPTQSQRLIALKHQPLPGMNPIGAETEGLIRGKTQQLTPGVLRRTERNSAGRKRRPSISGCPGIILRFCDQCNG